MFPCPLGKRNFGNSISDISLLKKTNRILTKYKYVFVNRLSGEQVISYIFLAKGVIKLVDQLTRRAL